MKIDIHDLCVKSNDKGVAIIVCYGSLILMNVVYHTITV